MKRYNLLNSYTIKKYISVCGDLFGIISYISYSYYFYPGVFIVFTRLKKIENIEEKICQGKKLKLTITL